MMLRACRLLLLCALLPVLAHGATPGCPGTSEIEPALLIGAWQVEWTDGARQRGEAPWTLVLGPHPQYAGSLKGHLSRGSEQHLVVADWDDDTLTLEESEDGQRIAATWQATATEGQCGRAFQGLRFTGSAPDASARRFRMRATSAR
mgnify:CR=1 FL=1